MRVAARDPRIRIALAGSGPRRNAGIGAATGEFIAFQDPSAFAHPQRIEIQLREFSADPDTVAAFGRTVRLTPEGLVGLDQTGAMLAEDGASLMCRAAIVPDLGGLCGDGPLADFEFRERIVSYYGSHVVAPMSAVLSLTPCRYWTGPAGPRETAEQERADAAFNSAWLKRHLLAKGRREALYMPL